MLNCLSRLQVFFYVEKRWKRVRASIWQLPILWPVMWIQARITPITSQFYLRILIRLTLVLCSVHIKLYQFISCIFFFFGKGEAQYWLGDVQMAEMQTWFKVRCDEELSFSSERIPWAVCVESVPSLCAHPMSCGLSQPVHWVCTATSLSHRRNLFFLLFSPLYFSLSNRSAEFFN